MIRLAFNTLALSDEGKTLRLINRVAYGLAAAIPVAVLAGCSGGGAAGGGAAPTASAAPEVSSMVIDVAPTADAAGIYIADDDGFFTQQGLSVKIVPISYGESGITDLQDGKAQLLEGNYVSIILAQVAGEFGLTPATAKPISMRVIADASQLQPGNQALYVLPGSPYQTVADVARDHATVGVNSPDSIAAVLLGSLLASDGYPLKAIRQTPEVLPLMPALLAAHKIDAAWLPEPFGTEAEQEYGAVQLADFDQGALQDFPIGSIAGSTAWVRQHPHTISAFLRAFQQGQQIADTQHSAVEQALMTSKVAPTQEIAATMTLDTYPLAMDVPVMQRVSDAMYAIGVLNKRYDIAGMIQPEPGEIK
jgi:NitT/TauT family transport system substrate-binding protein